MTTVYLGIGSNLKDREANCDRSILLLEDAGIKVKTRSKPVETKPWGVEDQPAFINMAAMAETSLEPLELLAALKNIEHEMGRNLQKDIPRWGPRLIDLDILLYGDSGDTVLETPELTIPHPRMHERAFVLAPLAEIAPQMMHPVLMKSVSQLLRELDEL